MCGKAGSEYEPYIFAAPNSARVMVALDCSFPQMWTERKSVSNLRFSFDDSQEGRNAAFAAEYEVLRIPLNLRYCFDWQEGWAAMEHLKYWPRETNPETGAAFEHLHHRQPLNRSRDRCDLLRRQFQHCVLQNLDAAALAGVLILDTPVFYVHAPGKFFVLRPCNRIIPLILSFPKKPVLSTSCGYGRTPHRS